MFGRVSLSAGLTIAALAACSHDAMTSGGATGRPSVIPPTQGAATANPAASVPLGGAGSRAANTSPPPNATPGSVGASMVGVSPAPGTAAAPGGMPPSSPAAPSGTAMQPAKPPAGTSPPPPAAPMAGPLGYMNVPTSKEPKIPTMKGACPEFKEGTTTSDFMGFKGAIWEVGPKSQGTGSLLFYWHGTGSSNSEYKQSLPPSLITDLKVKGGILVSPQSGTGSGGDCSGTATFAIGDFAIADQIVACAVENWGIDPHRIYSTGCSAGGLQAGCMALMRSSYMAAAVPNSGGEFAPVAAQDPSHIPAMMTMHGKAGQDVVIIDFSNTSASIDTAIKGAGGYAVDCDHGGGHCAIPMPPVDLYMAGWQFMQEHPFGYTKEPYGSMLPADFPKYCKVW